MKEIITFLFFTTFLSAIFYFFIIQQGTIKSPGNLLMLGLMWCPGMAAILTQYLYHKKFNYSIFKLPPMQYLLLSYCIPLLYSLVAYSLIWSVGVGEFFDPDFLAVVSQRYAFVGASPMILLIFHIIFSMTFGILIKSVFTLGEELGWRGFLVPKLLQMTSATKTALISGGIWAIWHYPMIIYADYNGRALTWFSIICFTIMIIGLSFLFTWFWIKTKSIWPAVLLHASHNLFIQQIFNPLTTSGWNTNYFIGEFGVGAACIGLVLIIILKPRLRTDRMSRS